MKIINIDKEIKRILEPSCGSCEFINYIDNIFNNRKSTLLCYKLM